MDVNNKIRLLLTLQEHPENLTDAEIKSLMADEEMSALVRQLTATKRAFVKQSLHEDDNLVNAEWEKFSKTHFAPSEDSRRWTRIAPIFGGITLSTGLVLAAILTVRHYNASTTHKTTTAITAPASVSTRQIIPADSTDNSVVVFHKSTLDDILVDIAAYYNADVEFQNDNARHMRLYFVWKKRYSLEQVIENLNNFEHIDLQEENNHIIVK